MKTATSLSAPSRTQLMPRDIRNHGILWVYEKFVFLILS